ncbi:hypothetical protein DFQ02_102244 [Seonamhaeicola aphaedonensis]|uniref:Uncharacterized protein n=1 Tax=Seonamhaeicola aphaedonensis TaxID=1461338 RepID=A0A3D9HJ06_9FLAO|nr:hypothetical protein DFQ02_102244 [Seonamhaeicola aphaedonensis]
MLKYSSFFYVNQLISNLKTRIYIGMNVVPLLNKNTGL